MKPIVLAAATAMLAMPAYAQHYSRGMNSIRDCARYGSNYDAVGKRKTDYMWRCDLQQNIDQQN
jgi:hypothetical protein